MNHEGKMVKVTWTDSGQFVDEGWASTQVFRDAAKSWDGEVVTIGTVIHEDDTTIVVGLSHDIANDTFYGGQLIWKVAITNISVVTVDPFATRDLRNAIVTAAGLPPLKVA